VLVIFFDHPFRRIVPATRFPYAPPSNMAFCFPKPPLLSPIVELAMAVAAEHDQIVCRIRARLAPGDEVVEVELIPPSAGLASPAVPLQDFLAQLLVGNGVPAKRAMLRDGWAHAAGRISSKKRCCWGGGSKRKNRRTDQSMTSGSPWSRFAPARKSAQIISKQ
jgi:hypothetical protein